MKYEIWEPFEEMKEFRKKMDKLFQEFHERRVMPPLKTGFQIREPLADVINKKEKIIAKIELPGINKKDIKVNVGNNKVEIKAQRSDTTEQKGKNFYRKERAYSGFYKAFTLPSTINPEKTTVKFDKGILTLEMSKTKGLLHKKQFLLK